MSNCDFTSSKGSTLAYLVGQKVINKDLSIINRKGFDNIYNNLKQFANDNYQVKEELFFITPDGKSITPNEIAFAKIDEFQSFGRHISFSIPDEDIPFDLSDYIGEAIDEDSVLSPDIEKVNSYDKVIKVVERRRANTYSKLNLVNKDIADETDKIALNKLLKDKNTLTQRIDFDNEVLENLKSIPQSGNIAIENFRKKIFDPDIERLQSILDNPDLTTSDLAYIAETIDMWKYVTDLNTIEKVGIINSKDVEEDGYILNLLLENAHKMARLERLFNKKMEQKLAEWGTQLAGKEVTKQQMFKSLKEAGKIAANTLNIADFGDNLLDLLYVEMKKREVEQNKKILNLFEKLDKAKKGLSKDELALLNQLDQYGNKTGNLVFPYAQEYFSTRTEKWNEYHYLKDNVSVTESLKYYETELKQWIKDNHVGIDVKRLLIDKDENYKKELIESLGQERFDEYSKSAEQKWESYQMQLEALKHTENEDAIKQFELQNSPIENHKNLFGKGKGRFNSNFYVYAPVKKHIDENYKKITANEKLKNYYDLLINISSNYQKLVPEHRKKEFQVNSLSFVKKGIVQDLVTNPLGFIQTSLSKLSESVSSQQETNVPTNIITNQEMPFVQLHLSSGNEMIDARYNAYIIDFMADVSKATSFDQIKSKYPVFDNKKVNFDAIKERWSSNKKNIPDYVLRYLKSKATDEIINKERTDDIDALIKNYIVAIESYTARKASEDVVRLVNIAFNNKKELTDNGEKEGLNNLKKLLAHQTKLFFQISVDESQKATQTNKKTYTRDEKETIAKLKQTKQKILEDSNLTEAGKAERIAIIDDKINSFGSKLTISKIGDMLLQYVTHLGLGWSITSGLGNLAFGHVANYTEAAGRKNFNEKQLNEGYLVASINSKFTDNGKKLNLLFKKFNLLKTATQELYKRGINQNESLTKYVEPMYLQETTEYFNQGPVAFAWLKNQKLSNWTQETVDPDATLWDNIDLNGEMKIPINEGLMKAKLDLLLNKLHGDYDSLTKSMAKNTFLGKAVSQFRTWMGKAFDQRFSRHQAATALNDETKGRWRSYSELFGENGINKTLSSLSFLLRKLYIGRFLKDSTDETFSELDAYNMRQNMAELAMFIKTMTLGLILKSLLLDDDEEKDGMLKYSLFLTINLLSRVETDIVFYVMPTEFEKLNKNFLPLARIITDAQRLTKFGYKLLTDEENSEENINKTLRYTGKLIPGPVSAIRIYDYMNNNYTNK